MPRKSKEAGPLTIGFFGAGEMPSDKVVSALLDEYLIGKGYATVNDKEEIEFGDITFLIPATKERYTDAIIAVVAYAQESDIPYELVHDEVSAKARNIAAAIKGASKTHKVARIGSKLAGELTKRDNAILVAIWADDDDELAKVVHAAQEAETPIRDLTMDMEEVDVTEQEDGAQAEEEAPEATDDAAEEEVSEEPYTEEELGQFELAELKAFCVENEIEVPERSRKPTYVKLIMEAQEAWAAEDAPAGDTDEVAEGRVIIEIPTAEEIATAVVEALFGQDGPMATVDEALSLLHEQVDKVMTLADEVLVELRTVQPDEEQEPEPEPEEKAPARRPLRRRL